MTRKPRFQQLQFEELDSTIKISEENEVTTTMEMKHLIYGISRTDVTMEGGPLAREEAEAAIKAKYFDAGWKLFQVFYLGSDPQFIQLLAVLIREQ